MVCRCASGASAALSSSWPSSWSWWRRPASSSSRETWPRLPMSSARASRALSASRPSGTSRAHIAISSLLGVVVAAAGFFFLSGNMATAPDVQPSRFTRSDGFSAQRKLYELVLRESGRSTRTDPVVLSEAEVNAFLANHLEEAAGLPFSPLVVRFAGGQLELRGQTVQIGR